MTVPNADDHTAADPDGTEHPSDVWTPAILRPAPEPFEEADAPGRGTAVAWHRVPEPPEPLWRSADRSRMVLLAGGRQTGIDPETTAELARLRDAATQADERLERQRALLGQLDRQLVEARHYATTEGLAARQAERRVAGLTDELASAHAELERLRAHGLARIDRVLAQVDDHHRSLIASLRSDADLADATRADDDDGSAWSAMNGDERAEAPGSEIGAPDADDRYRPGE